MAIAVAGLLLASCSDDQPSDHPSDHPSADESQPPWPIDLELETFNTEAATLCTEIVNDAVVGRDLPSPDEVYVAVLDATSEGGAPTAARRAAWAHELTDHVDAARTTRERLSSLDAPSASVGDLWAQVVASYDDTAMILNERATALMDGPWVDVRVAFGERLDSSDVGVALTGIGLGSSDCGNVFTPALVQPPMRWREFTATASTVCTEIANRRALAAYGGDVDRVSFAEDQVADREALTSPDDVDAALGRFVAEWRQTGEDFSEIDAAESPSPPTWRALGDLAAERVALAEQRRAAIATSNDAAIAAAFAVPDYAHTSFGFELLLLESRSCGGLGT